MPVFFSYYTIGRVLLTDVYECSKSLRPLLLLNWFVAFKKWPAGTGAIPPGYLDSVARDVVASRQENVSYYSCAREVK